MAWEDLNEVDQKELADLRKMLYRAVRELEYVNSLAGTEYRELVASGEGKEIVEVGMKLLGVADLSEDELPRRLITA